MSRTQAIEAVLADWRDADRRLTGAVDGEADGLMGDVVRHRGDYQRLAAESMDDWVRSRDEAERRNSHLLPSTGPFEDRDLEGDLGPGVKDDAGSNDVVEGPVGGASLREKVEARGAVADLASLPDIDAVAGSETDES